MLQSEVKNLDIICIKQIDHTKQIWFSNVMQIVTAMNSLVEGLTTFYCDIMDQNKENSKSYSTAKIASMKKGLHWLQQLSIYW